MSRCFTFFCRFRFHGRSSVFVANLELLRLWDATAHPPSGFRSLFSLARVALHSPATRVALHSPAGAQIMGAVNTVPVAVFEQPPKRRRRRDNTDPDAPSPGTLLPDGTRLPDGRLNTTRRPNRAQYYQPQQQANQSQHLPGAQLLQTPPAFTPAQPESQDDLQQQTMHLKSLLGL